MKVSICGFGYLGMPLATLLKSRGYNVLGTTTTKEKIAPAIELLCSPVLPSENILDCDILILNIPPFEGQIDWFKQWDLNRVKKVIFVSSTSVLRPEGIHNEILRKEEDWVRSLRKDFLIVRPGGLLGHGRHPGKQLSGKSGIKGRLWPVNVIHVEDVIGFLVTAIEKNLSGEIFDLVSDEHHTKEEFYSDYCRRLQIPLPEFDLTDKSTGFIVSNEKMKRHYPLKFPTMLGRSL